MKAVYSLQKDERKVYDTVIADDIVGRQTVILKDAQNYLEPMGGYLIYYEGSEEASRRMEDLSKGTIKRLDKAQESLVLEKIQEEEDRAEGGMGFLFG